MTTNTSTTPSAYLLTLKSIRERTRLLLDNPTQLAHFDVHLDKLDAVVNTIVMLIVRDYSSPSDIPPHSRWRHFEAVSPAMKATKCDRISPLLNTWNGSVSSAKDQPPKYERETIRRLLDLFVISVLLDAGAGNKWSFRPSNEPGESYVRSEGLALASLDWFVAGGFSSDPNAFPNRADAVGLKAVTADKLQKAFQVNESNPLVGVDGRCSLLNRLGDVCLAHPKYFGSDTPRPGNLVDYLLDHPSTVHSEDGSEHSVNISVLWEVVIHAFSGVWPPARTVLDGVFLGDVWPCSSLASILSNSTTGLGGEADSLGLVPFHKLSQWLTYSLMEPMSLLGVRFIGVEDLTGLAEYRNGGLFVDMGVLSLRSSSIKTMTQGPESVPRFNVFDDAVVEWRALTIGLLDLVGDAVRKRLSMSKDDLPLAKILEAGTWKAGREVAASLRPVSRGSPIDIISDGTVF
ncbi:hypothetical protein BATDEDRAFT_86299 [Batrachochytrium dendrobatidis JAM81]|uniref:Uracil catabolism protein 4 n=1 Tax=Batrachochytrium dendrobatidis (strain JAM81 / FGSC 10211) TaxID=684364 RepID=F4NWJ0_BATDJ|nr:uncharacterized protein BATDEDRAFT_86299 [Batrachochytrium dendrobatidis JAM81]EGF82488.1 hypothetical protein BATDEDRAFT_86299 [Batrachochytrium dendrobatidis JAM81]KAJ8328022.1 hypothetical protein O5D80_003407 [Batrachochytrium dendrobatidis]KAK5667033.1 hypothetical protein QVD99_006249 [Batrachochytrium dendrobatidis]|eukprot:XP_006676942.1 hypothetical protein BATDEDRAFT_86299 [Batrachochytrium dendrobatidis JAM81]